jgi:hypothetical protein
MSTSSGTSATTYNFAQQWACTGRSGNPRTRLVSPEGQHKRRRVFQPFLGIAKRIVRQDQLPLGAHIRPAGRRMR